MTTENMNVMESLKHLHVDCDWILQNFDTRREARIGEIDALEESQGCRLRCQILFGAGFACSPPLLKSCSDKFALKRTFLVFVCEKIGRSSQEWFVLRLFVILI